jgi:hypothetical protein
VVRQKYRGPCRFGPPSAASPLETLYFEGKLRKARNEIERRQWTRLPLAIPLFVRGKGEQEKEILEFASAINVSAGGALVAIRRSLPLFSQVSVEIPTAPFASSEAFPQAVRLLPAQIIRLTHGEGHHLMGLKFAAPIDSAVSDRRVPARKTVSPV